MFTQAQISRRRSSSTESRTVAVRKLRSVAGAVLESLETRRLLSVSYVNTTQIYDPIPAPGEQFGARMDASGNQVLVGRLLETVEILGNPEFVGAATLYEYDPDTDTVSEIVTFENPDPDAQDLGVSGDHFGASVAILGNGQVAISSLEPDGSGNVYIFDDTGLLLTTVDHFPVANSFFGTTIAAYDGDVLVHSPSVTGFGGHGNVQLFDSDTGDLLQTYDQEVTGDQFGFRMDVDEVNNRLLFSGAIAGPTAAVFEMDALTGDVVQTYFNPGADNFGAAVAFAGTTTVLIGTAGSDVAYQFNRSDGVTPLRTIADPDPDLSANFGASLVVSGDEVLIGSLNQVDNGASSGAAYVFNHLTGDFIATIENPTPVPTNETFGATLAALEDGGAWAIGDPEDDAMDEDAGGIYIFEPQVIVDNTEPIAGPIVAENEAVRNQPVDFSASFTDPDLGDTHEVSWDFGDGNVIAFHSADDDGALTPTHAYTTNGVFTVTFAVKDAAGATDDSTDSVTVAASDEQAGTLFVGGTNGADDVTLRRSSPPGSTELTFNGVTTTHNVNRIVVYGGAGNDTVDASNGVDALVEFYGAAGNDRIAGGGTGDILVGGDDNDTVTGGKGRDVIIGGTGADHLSGDQDDDIIIAPYTVHDEDSTALNSILTEWNSAASYSARVALLQSTMLRPNVDVFDDAMSDTLIGSGGSDWFIFNADAGVTDNAKDVKVFETATDVDPAP